MSTTFKCTICGGNHLIFNCINKCAVCSGDNRQCSCPAQPPQKKKRKAPQSNQQPEDKPSYQKLKKKYDTLVKDHERVGQSFQNQQPQNQELAAELEEQEKDAEELANLVQTKSEAIKTLQTKLVDAKRTIAKLKAELKTLCQRSADKPQQQPQQKDATCASTHSLATIHTRYQRVLQILKENNCSMANAFWLAGCPRSTIRDFIAIAELRIVDER